VIDVGSDYPHSESTFPQSRKILAEILDGVPDEEQAEPAPDHDPGSPVTTVHVCTALMCRG